MIGRSKTLLYLTNLDMIMAFCMICVDYLLDQNKKCDGV